MKINNIKINSYGNIHNKEMKFTEGINIIKGKNESGKSTILNYIVSMFYGVSRNKEGNKLSDYEKYKPWTGEEFSGKIEYNLDSGEKFEVFRDFNKKNPQIYNENYENISDKYNLNKKEGNQFFLMQTNVEKPMYLSTVVSTQQEVRLDEKNQNMLLQKIANLAGTGEDNVSYKKAVTKLQDKMRDEIGTSKTSLKPINIAQNELHNIEIEIKKIEPYENEKYSIDQEKAEAKRQIDKLENEKKLAADLKNIYEEQNATMQELELKKKDKQDNLYNLNILKEKENIYEKNKEEITKNIHEAEEIKKVKEIELDNLAEKEVTPKKRKKNFMLFVIESILIIFLILNICFIKSNLINIAFSVAILLVFAIYVIRINQINNKYKRILEENTKRIEQERQNLLRKIQEINEDIQSIQAEEKENNEELSMTKGKIDLLMKKIKEETAAIEEREEKISNNLKISKEALVKKYEKDIDGSRLSEMLSADTINYELQSIENKLNSSILKLKALELEEKNILPQLDKLIVLKEKQVAINERIDELKENQKIINMALENLSEAYEEMKTTITPKFTQNLSKNMDKISNGKYDKVSINDETGMIVENKNGEYIEAYKLSTGTIDQLYLSLRLSMIDEISKEKLPIILDETFAYFDDERIKNVLAYVVNDLEKRQTIIFTCSNREVEILQDLKLNYNLIEI